MHARQRTLVVIVSAVALVWALPGSALANGVVSEVETGAATTGPTASGAEVTSTFQCDASDVLVGGGARVFDTMANPPANSLKLNGTYPSNSGGSVVTSGTTTYWTALGGSGGQAPGSNARTQGWAMCAQSDNAPSSTSIVSSEVDGPNGTATATCSEGSWAIGGGAVITPGTTYNSLKPTGTFPSDGSGNAASNSSTNPTSWTATGNGGTTGTGSPKIRAFAICTSDSDYGVTVVHVEDTSNPTSASTAHSVVASCPTNRALISGGAWAENGGGAPQQGVHLTGTYPSESGSPAADESTSADSWTATVQTGGQSASGTDSHSFALCETTG